MKNRKRAIVGCLGVFTLAVAGLGTMVTLNWEAVSKDFVDSLDARSEKTRVTLFRWGELMSIGAELRSQYGTEPEMAYDTGPGGRVLSITFNGYEPPEGVPFEDHARGIAAFAVGRTKKHDEIDAVEVAFRIATGGPVSYSFTLAELTTASP